MHRFDLAGCTLIMFALCISINAEFNMAPPDDITAAAGQTVRLHWEYPQSYAETVTIALTKHGPDDIAFTMECLNATDKGVLCDNGAGYANVMLEKANKSHQGRYDMAITNGFKERKFFNIHIIDLNTTLLDSRGEVMYFFPQFNASDNVMNEYNIMGLPDLELNCSSEYTLLLEMSESESYNVTCFFLHADQRDYSIYRANQSEVRYDFYAFPSLVNRPVYLECEVSQTTQHFLIRHRVHIKERETTPNPTPPELQSVIERIPSHFFRMYILLGIVLFLLAVLIVCHVYHAHTTSPSKLSVEAPRRNEDLPLVQRAEVLQEVTGTQIVAVIKDLKEQINQFSHLRDERTIRMLSALHHLCKPKQRTLSDRSETGE